VKPERDGFVRVTHSTHPVAADAVGEIAAELIELDLARPDLLMVFVTKPFAGILEDIAPALDRLLSPTTLVGCASEQVIAPDGWLVDGPGIAVMAINKGEVEGLRYGPEVSIETSGPGTYLLLADPFSYNVSLLSDVCGGYAQAGEGPGSTRLVLDNQVFVDGAVGVRFPAGSGLSTYADDFLLDSDAWTRGEAVLAFKEVDVELWGRTLDPALVEAGGAEIAPVMTGIVSRRTFPLSLTVFGAQNAREQENKES
jgi:hypothetical protein